MDPKKGRTTYVERIFNGVRSVAPSRTARRA
jgi:hypothetical protein